MERTDENFARFQQTRRRTSYRAALNRISGLADIWDNYRDSYRLVCVHIYAADCHLMETIDPEGETVFIMPDCHRDWIGNDLFTVELILFEHFLSEGYSLDEPQIEL